MSSIAERKKMEAAGVITSLYSHTNMLINIFLHSVVLTPDTNDPPATLDTNGALNN